MAAYGKQPDKTLVGKKIKLIKLKSLKLDIDTTGVIESVDSITGKIHVKWDTDLESTLTPGVDEYEIQFADEDFSKYMGTKGESYIIDKSGQGERELFYLIRAKSPHHMVDMFFSSMPEAKKFADKKGLVIKDKIEEKYVDGGVIGESEVLTYLKTKHGVEENQITVGKDNKGKWNILIIDSELDPKTVSKWEKEVNKVFTKGKIVHKTISFDANNHITYYNGELTFQNIKDLTGITPVKIQNIEYVEIEDVDPFIKWSATELKNMFGYDIQNIIFSKKVLSDNEIEILDAYAITDDELHSFKYSPMIHTWYSIEEDENREKYGSDEDFGNGGSISNELESFDLNDLDPFETMQYNQFSKSLTKSESLQVLINNVEGDYSQLSPKLAELAEIQNPSEEYADGGPITDMQTLNSFHDWLRFDSKDADTHDDVLMSLKYTSPVAENNYLQKIYPKYKDEFEVYMEKNPDSYYANGGGIRKNGGSINKQETELTLENGTVFYIDEVPKDIKGTRERRESELVSKGVNLFFLKNIIGAKGTGVVADTSALDVLATDLEDIKQPTEADVRRAMILKIGYEGDLFYSLKAGGESNSDNQYSSSVTATFEGTKNGEDTDRVIIKKYNSDFKKVLITGAEVREIKRIILKIKRTKLMREDEVQGTIDFIASSERRGKVDISDGGTQPYTEEFRKAMIEKILDLAGDDVKLIAHCINYRVNQARKEIERIGDQDCIYLVDDKYMTLERCKEQTKKEKDRNFNGIEIYTKIHADIIAEMRDRNNSPKMAAANGANLQSPIEQVLRKHFQKTNREGMGFLESDIVACVKDLELLCSKPVKHSSKDIDNWILSQMEKKAKIGFGDNVHVPEINKSGIVVEVQGEAVKVKFVDGSTGEFEKKDVHKIASDGIDIELTQDVINYNKLISDYVGNDVEGGKYETLQYHSSWDWMMPVVKKILATEPPKESEGWYAYGAIENFLTMIDLPKVHENVVIYIKWHNSNKAKNGKILNPPLTQISIGELVPVSEIKSGIVIDKQNDIIKVRFVDGSTGEFNNKDIQALIIDSMSKLRFHALYSELNKVQKKEIDRLIEHPEKKEVGDTIVFNGFDTRGRRERSTVLIHSIDEDHRNFQGINNLGIIRTYPIGHLKESYIIGINKNKKAKHGALLHHTFTYQNTPDEKWEVEYEMDRDFPIISAITINGQQTDIDSYDEDIIMKVSMEAYQDYIDNLMTSGEYSREDFAANGKEVESYESYDDFVKKNIGEKKFVIVVGSGGGHQSLEGATKESIDVMFKDLVFHDFMDSNFKSNYCPDEYEKEYIEIIKKFYNELINNPKAFKEFWSKYIVKSGHYDGKYAIQSPHYTKEGKRIEYVKIKDKWIHAVKLDGEWIPQEVENYPDVVFYKYKSEISKGLKDAYSKYLQEYAGENIDLAADGKKVSSSNIRTIVFKHKNNPSLNITVKAYPNMQITEIENPRHVRFPFVVGQVLNMGHQTWACNNNYLVNDKDVCPEKKVMGIKVSDIPQGHPLRHLYPGKFH